MWFQNRRAKWRRQEKMDNTSMKLHDSAMLSFNRPQMPPSVGPVANPMPLDPWLTSPISSATPMHTIPGFMGSPQGLQPAYQSHAFLNTPPGMVQGMQPMGPPPYQCPPSFTDKSPMEDDRSSSIAALRMKAKEHIQSMDKTWQHMWSDVQDDFLQLLPQSTVLLFIFIFVQPTREDRTLHQRSYIEMNMGFIILKKKITCKNIFLVYLHIFCGCNIESKEMNRFIWRTFLFEAYFLERQPIEVTFLYMIWVNLWKYSFYKSTKVEDCRYFPCFFFEMTGSFPDFIVGRIRDLDYVFVVREINLCLRPSAL